MADMIGILESHSIKRILLLFFQLEFRSMTFNHHLPFDQNVIKMAKNLIGILLIPQVRLTEERLFSLKLHVASIKMYCHDQDAIRI